MARWWCSGLAFKKFIAAALLLVAAFMGIFICALLKHITQKSYFLGLLEISKLSIMDCLLHGNETKQKETLLITYT